MWHESPYLAKIALDRTYRFLSEIRSRGAGRPPEQIYEFNESFDVHYLSDDGTGRVWSERGVVDSRIEIFGTRDAFAMPFEAANYVVPPNSTAALPANTPEARQQAREAYARAERHLRMLTRGTAENAEESESKANEAGD